MHCGLPEFGEILSIKTSLTHKTNRVMINRQFEED